MASLRASLLGPHELDPDSETVTISPNQFHHPSIAPVNHSSYHHYPTAREYEPGNALI